MSYLIQDFDHLKIGKPGRGINWKDELGKEPKPEGGHPKAGQCARGEK